MQRMKSIQNCDYQKKRNKEKHQERLAKRLLADGPERISTCQCGQLFVSKTMGVGIYTKQEITFDKCVHCRGVK